jgi:hypothetical protein
LSPFHVVAGTQPNKPFTTSFSTENSFRRHTFLKCNLLPDLTAIRPTPILGDNARAREKTCPEKDFSLFPNHGNAYRAAMPIK